LGACAFPLGLGLTILRQLRFAVVINYLRGPPAGGSEQIAGHRPQSKLTPPYRGRLRAATDGPGLSSSSPGTAIDLNRENNFEGTIGGALSVALRAEGSSFSVRTDFCAGVGPAAIDGTRPARSLARTPRFSGLILQDIHPDRRTTSCCIFGVGADPRAQLERHSVEAGRTRQHK